MTPKSPEEIWKTIIGWEYYEASNLGRIKSLSRVVTRGDMQKQSIPERILKPGIDGHGYAKVVLCQDGIRKTCTVHRLVIESFLGSSDLDIDHINGIKTDNRLDNLRYCTRRQNMSFENVKWKKSSRFVGVSFCRTTEKWVASIQVSGRNKKIGAFDSEKDAAKAYQTTLKSIV
jgi:hypothetical protein